MAHDFRKTGNWYISKAGSSGNNGTTADTPKNTLPPIVAAVGNTGTTQTIIVGTGEYQNIPAFNFNNPYFILQADGKVLYECNSTNSPVFTNFKTDLYDLEFRNCLSFNRSYVGGNFQVQLQAYRCIVAMQQRAPNNWVDSQNGYMQWNDSTITNADGSNGSNGGGTGVGSTADAGGFYNCLIFNSNLRNYKLINSYVSADSKISVPNVLTTNLLNCNIQGQIKLSSEPESAYTDIESFKTAKGLSQRTDLFSAEPSFTNPFTSSYTLLPDSPHLGPNIGPRHLRLANALVLKGPEGDVNSSSGHYFEQSDGGTVNIIAAQNLTATLQESQLRLKVKESVGGILTGKFRTAPIRLAPVPQRLNRLTFSAGLNFDSDYPALENQFDPNNIEVYNNNVPNTFNYTSGHAGRNPNRLETLFRWSNKDHPQDGTQTDWVSGGSFLVFEWDVDMLYNPATLVGNGSPDFLLANETTEQNAPISPFATFGQFEVTLMNNYYSR